VIPAVAEEEAGQRKADRQRRPRGREVERTEEEVIAREPASFNCIGGRK
jgi:hypothetical protein